MDFYTTASLGVDGRKKTENLLLEQAIISIRLISAVVCISAKTVFIESISQLRKLSKSNQFQDT